MPRYDAAIFDLDGTLLDTLDDLTDAVNAALSELGCPPRSRAQVRQFVGSGVKLLIDRALPPDAGQDTRTRCLAYFKAYYAAHMQDKTVPYPGIPEMLRAVRAGGCAVAVVSNKFDTAVQALCRHCLPGLTDCVGGESPAVPRKPDPAMVRSALSRLGVPAQRAVYVGDSEVDIETARNAGTACISVTWGFREKDLLARCGARVFAGEPAQLPRLILG